MLLKVVVYHNIDSVFGASKIYCPQVLLEECKYIVNPLRPISSLI